jgi:nucleotide-binding universal stress UspA family protein
MQLPVWRRIMNRNGRHAGNTEPLKVKNILLAIEDCEATTIASPLLERALELAGAFSSKVWLIHVVPHPGQPPFNVDREVMRREVAAEYRHEHDFLQHLAQCLRDRGIDATSLLVEGSPAATLLEEASRLQADLIMLGCHRHGMAYGVLLDATEEGLLGKCRWPMMFVPVNQG